MSDKESVLKSVEEKIKDAAKAVEDFADKVAAPQEPVVILPPDDAPTETVPGAKKDSQPK